MPEGAAGRPTVRWHQVDILPPDGGGVGGLKQHRQHGAVDVADVGGVPVEAVDGGQGRRERAVAWPASQAAARGGPWGDPTVDEVPGDLAGGLLPGQVADAAPLLEPLEMPGVGLGRGLGSTAGEPQVPQLVVDGPDRLEGEPAEHRPVGQAGPDLDAGDIGRPDRTHRVGRHAGQPTPLAWKVQNVVSYTING